MIYTNIYIYEKQGRRSVIKYFVKKILSGQTGSATNTTLIQRVIVAQLRNMIADWTNTSTFSCLCEDTQEHAPSCCDPDNETAWLPQNLRRPFQDINSSHVLDALDKEYATIYNLSIQDFSPWIQYNDDYQADRYDWSDSQRAQDEGLFNPRHPTYNYSDNRLKVEVEASGLWSVCHASLKQIFFTLPVYNGQLVGFDTIDIFNGDPATLEATIRSIVDLAWEHSPLYRHYHPRYHPSQSQMCEQSDFSSNQAGSMQYDDYVQATYPILSGTDVSGGASIPLYAYDAFAMGQKTCTCGWAYDEITGECIIPTSEGTCSLLCNKVVPCATLTCRYKATLYDSLLQNRTAEFSSWSCPLLRMSSHWFVLNADTQRQWMSMASVVPTSTLSLSTQDLLRYGRSGLRLGNVKDIIQNPTQYVSPGQHRVVPLSHGVLHSCDYDTRLQETMDPMELAEELFPIAHGLAEGAVASYCLRYLVEKARLTVLQITANMSMFASAKNVIQQQETVFKWGRKCGSQVHLLHLCTSLNVFVAPDITNIEAKKCSFFDIERAPDFYTTPECLAYIDGVFYDPCRCLPDACGSQQTYPPPKLDRYAVLNGGSKCRLRFDPRNGLATHLNAPIGAWEGQTFDYVDLYLNTTALLQALLSDKDAVGNTPTSTLSTWMDEEGFMSSSASGGLSSDECDLMLDYWPDNWDYPVGYHVSTTCDAQDNAYRSFVNAFTEDIDAVTDPANPVPVLKYQHDLMRPGADIDTYWGVSGLCRQNNFGMQLVNLNTMVYCTRIRKDERVDPTIPNFTQYDSDNVFGYTDESCGASSTDLPWDTLQAGAVYSSVLYSLGTIPNMPTSSGIYYPESLDIDMLDVGSEAMLLQSWKQDGITCGDYPMLFCSDTTACSADYVCRGRQCSTAASYLQCSNDTGCPPGTGVCQGVCMHSSVQCIRHSDCRDAGGEFANYMCTGMNTGCVFCHVFSVMGENRLWTLRAAPDHRLQQQQHHVVCCTIPSAECLQRHRHRDWQRVLAAWRLVLGIHGRGPACAARHVLVHQLVQVQDILPAAMHQHPVKQQRVLDRPRGHSHCGHVSSILQQQQAVVAARLVYIHCIYSFFGFTDHWDFFFNTDSQNPNIMYVRPTVCDRDHERLAGFTHVSPRQEDVVFVFTGMQKVQPKHMSTSDIYFPRQANVSV